MHARPPSAAADAGSAAPQPRHVENDSTSRLLGRSAAVRGVRELVRRVAGAPRSTVLVTGESGSGKELVARAVHGSSARAARPFVAMNCASLSDALFEAELFGYGPGAFTGGNPRGQDGLVAAAEGGTLFLDEIGELGAPAQAKLLRFLQEKSYRRVGESRERACDVRVVAATNRDLSERVERGLFREDLYYRLNVLSIHVPPLRERREDLAELAAAKLASLAAEQGRAAPRVAPEALAQLERHAWPGNVRELENVLARALVLADGEWIDGAVLALAGVRAGREEAAPDRAREAELLAPRAGTLRDAEQDLIRQALATSRGNRSRAARELGIHRATLYTKMKSYGIQ